MNHKARKQALVCVCGSSSSRLDLCGRTVIVHRVVASNGGIRWGVLDGCNDRRILVNGASTRSTTTHNPNPTRSCIKVAYALDVPAFFSNATWNHIVRETLVLLSANQVFLLSLIILLVVCSVTVDNRHCCLIIP